MQAWGITRHLRGGVMFDIQVGLHVFLVVLILGTLWRVTSFHLIASPNSSLEHLGKAMSIQY